MFSCHIIKGLEVLCHLCRQLSQAVLHHFWLHSIVVLKFASLLAPLQFCAHTNKLPYLAHMSILLLYDPLPVGVSLPLNFDISCNLKTANHECVLTVFICM